MRGSCAPFFLAFWTLEPDDNQKEHWDQYQEYHRQNRDCIHLATTPKTALV
jgi:hypothetical protein